MGPRRRPATLVGRFHFGPALIEFILLQTPSESCYPRAFCWSSLTELAWTSPRTAFHILLKGHDDFHARKGRVLPNGASNQGGTLHATITVGFGIKGKAAVCNAHNWLTTCSPVFSTTDSKSRLNFPSSLCQPRRTVSALRKKLAFAWILKGAGISSEARSWLGDGGLDGPRKLGKEQLTAWGIPAKLTGRQLSEAAFVNGKL